MKPISLAMKGFRSYPKPVTIDFTDKGLTAVLGDTGAGKSVPRQVVGRFSVSGKLGIIGSTRPRWTSAGRFQAMASCGRTVLYSTR